MKAPEVFSSEEGLLIISRGTAIILLGVYGAYLYFQVWSFPSHQIVISGFLTSAHSSSLITSCSKARRRARRKRNPT
jgi:hypothetical protein